MPFFEKLMKNLNSSTYDTFNYFLETRNKSIVEFWADIDDAIISTTLGKLNLINRQVLNFNKKHQDKTPKTFELVRCDFILDEDFNLYLMEVNM